MFFILVERKWRQELENYLLATEKDEHADKIKIAILLNLLGSEVLEIFNTFKFEPPESQKNYSEVLKKFEDYCSPPQNATDNGLKERLLRESSLGLEKAIEIVRAAETSREQLRSMKEETAVTINSVKRNRSQNQPKQSSQEYECKKCGRKHKPHECPAYGKVCAKCNKKNHFVVKCFQNSKNIHEMKVPENELEIYINSVTE
ncbi:hypothetical protein AVEN_268019-1 [Araneus ventricosus]|uniref:CCHC-type domain-containing protein n=1 Tax=Araneus ventricosus TaxID=182803 RepID=A0A4Y2SSJ3_ARAVE|nr:hypothetical protein AVEN_268019-1 [Araneus ventricosus]